MIDDFVPLSDADRDQLSSSLLRFLEQLEPLVLEGLGAEVPDSRAERLAAIETPDGSQGPRPGRNALETALFGTVAGIDHSRQAAIALRDGRATFALATLTRGALESYARASWLIDTTSDEDLLTRWLSGIAAELSWSIKVRPGAPLMELRGRHSTAEAELVRVLDDIEDLTGSRKPLSASSTALASDLLDRAGWKGRAAYSQLSAVAHGEPMGIHGFVDISDSTGAHTVQLHQRWALSYVGQLLATSTFVGRNLLRTLGRDVGPTHPSAAAHTEAARVVETLKSRIRAAAKPPTPDQPSEDENS